MSRKITGFLRAASTDLCIRSKTDVSSALSEIAVSIDEFSMEFAVVPANSDTGSYRTLGTK